MKTNVKICACGDCEAAINRALRVCEQMFNDGECAIFQVAVGAAFGGIMKAALMATIHEQAIGSGMPKDLVHASLGLSAEYNIAVIEERMTAHFASRRSEMYDKVGKWYKAFHSRVAADREACQSDSPEIKGGPKAT